ncbi:NADP-dependent oxidoreductase [Arthrobacter sp. KBS0703]|uniref:NADP-dependent oxidoreductase n=1 Tax=Arthrobacter sp. KBS0703 TaxID=1955698 RepID=UPI00098F9329|nr:NADP-dependent oxidoreductase [Arthrobacter sp. KBS0703]TSE17060.1 NADP-dependent oxidoreductase [Arthrobacter sp. KBS0703]
MSTRVYFDEYGGPHVLQVGTEELPEAGEGEVRVEFRAVSVNPVDWKLVAGYLKQWAPLDLPAVPGSEAAGVVTAVGPAFEGFAVGDEVIWNGLTGGYRTEALVPAEQLTPIPAGVDFEQAACIPVAGGTAYSALKQLGVGPGDTVLIHAAAGGVGSAAVQIAAALGARVVGTASESNHEYLRELGAEPVTYGAGLADRVRDLSDAIGDVTAVFDTIGNEEAVAATAELLQGRSRAVTTVPGKLSAEAGIAAVRQLEGRVEEVATLAADGQITFTISHRMPLIEAADALEISRAGHGRGKIVLLP